MSKFEVRARLGRQWATSSSCVAAQKTSAVTIECRCWATWATTFPKTSVEEQTDSGAAGRCSADENCRRLPTSPAQVAQVAQGAQLPWPMRMSWTERLRGIRAAAGRGPRLPDAWIAELTSAEGVKSGGLELLPTYAAFDHLGLSRAERTPAAARRLGRVMCDLGWQKSRFRIASGSRQRVRGFKRQTKSGS